MTTLSPKSELHVAEVVQRSAGNDSRWNRTALAIERAGLERTVVVAIECAVRVVVGLGTAVFVLEAVYVFRLERTAVGRIEQTI